VPLFLTRGGPTLLELTRQALSSTQRGYDLLAPKFERSPFRTSDRILAATATALQELGPFGSGLDLCCGTGLGVDRVLKKVCTGPVTGVDFSEGMLAEARRAHPGPAHWVRADARALPFTNAFDLVVSFGAFGHFLPRERPVLFEQVHAALRPGGLFAFPLGTWSPAWALFDAVMRVRNALWRPQFIMYYRTWPPHRVRDDLTSAGFSVRVQDWLVLATRTA
jgi:SAM-dependent methyltransferase